MSEGLYCAKCEYPIRDGEPCENCADVERLRRARLSFERARLVDAMGGQRAADEFTYERLKVTNVNQRAVEAVRDFDFTKDNLYLHGPTGAGKTHMACAAARKAVETGSVRFVKLADLARDIRAAGTATQEAAVMFHNKAMKVLVIDDVGVGKPTEFLTGLLYELVDWRDMNRPGGLIVTSNLSLDDLALWVGDDRVSSRLFRMCRNLSLVGEKDWRVT